MPSGYSLLRFTTFCRLLLLAVLCCGYAAQAQRYPFYNLNIENGLIQSQATSLVQDQEGHLWIGTIGGLSRYDGKTFTNYTVRDSMISNMVTSLLFDEEQHLWIGTPKGLSSFDGRRFRHYLLRPSEQGGSSIEYSGLAQGPGNSIFCLSEGALYRVTRGRSVPLPLPDTSSTAICMTYNNGILDVANNKGIVYHWNGTAWDSTRTPVADHLDASIIINLFRDQRRQLWIMTNKELYRARGKEVTLFNPGGKTGLRLPPMRCATQDKQGNIWIGTHNGVLRITDSTIQAYNKKNGLTDNRIRAALTDAEGNVWLASDGQGIFRFSGAPMVSIDESTGLPSEQIMSIAANNSGDVFLGTYDAGLLAYNEHTGIRRLAFPNDATPVINTMTVRKNELWIGTRGMGVFRLRSGQIEPFGRRQRNMPSYFISNLYTDKQDAVWVGFANGFGRICKDTFERLSRRPINVYDFQETGQDSMLMVAEEGIFLWQHGALQPFRTNGPADVASPQCVTVRGDELWFGTSDNGIIGYSMRTGQSTVFNKNNGLRSDFIYNIVCDNEGNVWAGTGFGIHKLSFSSGKPVIAFFGKGQGVSGLESNHNAVWKMPDGSIWFGTTNGALHYRPGATMIQAKPTGLVLQSVRVFGEDLRDSSYYTGTDSWYGVPQGLKLPYRKNNITFTFQGISLSGSENLLYRYRIEGLEAPWSDWSTTTSVTFSAVPSGKYTLHIQCSTDGKNTDQELSYAFEIITPFHKTGLFRLVILGGCILLGISIQYLANRRKRNREMLLEKMRREEQNKVRQRTAEDFHDEVGNKLTRINVLTNVLKAKVGSLSQDALKIIDQIQDNTGQLYSGTRDILWSLKPSNDNMYEILHRIRDFGVELFQYTDIDFVFTGTDERWKNYRLPLDYSRNLTMIFKEALNNSLKYAGASRVMLNVDLDATDNLTIHLQDNGRGFSIDQVKRGHGIDNMNVRTRRLGGTLTMHSKPSQGSEIRLTFKIPSNKG